MIDKPAFSFNYGYFYGGVARLALNTSPLLPDTDGDGLCAADDSEPLWPLSQEDTDGDGIPDAWLEYWFGEDMPEADEDPYGCGMSIRTAFMLAINPTIPATEALTPEDGLEYGEIIPHGFNVASVP